MHLMVESALFPQLAAALATFLCEQISQQFFDLAYDKVSADF